MMFRNLCLTRLCRILIFLVIPLLSSLYTGKAQALVIEQTNSNHERISLNSGWRFWRSEKNPDGIAYDVRPDILVPVTVLKPWILPSANDFINDATKHYKPPTERPPTDNVSYIRNKFDDSAWEKVDLPHDWAIKGPFYVGDPVPVGGGMGRLPVQGVGWYRRKLSYTSSDEGKSLYLDIDGAMSYAMVWLNGNLVGGWPYGYNSFRLDLTPHLHLGSNNQLAIRLDNPTESARWYPGGGLYRNVWITKVSQTHVAHWGTFITSKNVSARSATLDLVVQVENRGNATKALEMVTDVHVFDPRTGKAGVKVAQFPRTSFNAPAGQKSTVKGTVTVDRPRLWGPPPAQEPNLYVAITRLNDGNNRALDTYETQFGIRSITYDANTGLAINGAHVQIRGVNQHHDLGALGAAFNYRAAERQLEILQEMGTNAIRMSHNPPAPELLELTDRMGFIVMDEVFDSWERNKTKSDFHLIFPEWHEADLRSYIRRDRNHPSIYAWSFGNEVGEQSTAEAGAALARSLNTMVGEEDATRPATASMNQAKPNSSFAQEMDIISLNYQGEGIRDAPAYSHLIGGTRTPPLYDAFHEKFPDKLIASSETAAALSTRGTYIFPVTGGISAPVNDSSGGNSAMAYVSAYELYSADFGSSADKVFAAQDSHPFVAGEFVWSGWDYLGEPTPYYSARSSYFGTIDLAGFKKDRYYLYQSRWRPEFRNVHILPHWNWPDRVGLVTPVHAFSSADEAELFVNGDSQGRIKKGLGLNAYRFRWDNVTYQPGEINVVTYKNGEEWAKNTVRTTGQPAKLRLTADRTVINNDGLDLSFITTEILDRRGDLVRPANDTITYSISGPGEIVATDNGNPTDLVAFPSRERKAFSGLALAIVRAKPGVSGVITVTATGPGSGRAQISIRTR